MAEGNPPLLENHNLPFASMSYMNRLPTIWALPYVEEKPEENKKPAKPKRAAGSASTTRRPKSSKTTPKTP